MPAPSVAAGQRSATRGVVNKPPPPAMVDETGNESDKGEYARVSESTLSSKNGIGLFGRSAERELRGGRLYLPVSNCCGDPSDAFACRSKACPRGRSIHPMSYCCSNRQTPSRASCSISLFTHQTCQQIPLTKHLHNRQTQQNQAFQAHTALLSHLPKHPKGHNGPTTRQNLPGCRTSAVGWWSTKIEQRTGGASTGRKLAPSPKPPGLVRADADPLHRRLWRRVSAWVVAFAPCTAGRDDQAQSHRRAPAGPWQPALAAKQLATIDQLTSSPHREVNIVSGSRRVSGDWRALAGHDPRRYRRSKDSFAACSIVWFQDNLPFWRLLPFRPLHPQAKTAGSSRRFSGRQLTWATQDMAAGCRTGISPTATASEEDQGAG